MKKACAFFLFLFAAMFLFADELDVSRQALRDGLWDVARTHASRVGGDEANTIILESYCREERWEDAARAMALWNVPATPIFTYYRALIHYKTGAFAQAEQTLQATNLTLSATLAPLVSRLRIQLALANKQPFEAFKLLQSDDFAKADAESRMLAAEVYSAIGNQEAAQKEWREVARDTNVTDRVLFTVAANLDDGDLLRTVYLRARDGDIRRSAGLRLGCFLLKDEKTFDEGATLIRAIAKDAPDAEGAREASAALAEAYFKGNRLDEASAMYSEILETWPPLAFQSNIQEGRGWVFRQLGKIEEALEAFVRAEELATNDVSRATAILEQGDVLSEMGRGEEALAKYRDVLARYPQTPAGEKLKVVVELRELEAKGRDFYKNYDFGEAQRLFARVAEKDPSRKPRMDFYTVLCLYGQGLDREASARALQLANESTDLSIRAKATMWLAKVAYNRRKWKESCLLFSSYADLQPDAADASFALLWAARAAFADNDFEQAIHFSSRLVERYPSATEKANVALMQAEALIELARFDEAVFVLDRAIADPETPAAERLRAQILRADALMAMGADNPARYHMALSAYQAIRQSEILSPSLKISVAFKMSRTLEKLKRMKEAMDLYYTSVVLAYREGRQNGVLFDDEARGAFARAAFRLADEYESRGEEFQAMHILELVVASDLPVSGEAEKRIDRIQTKGKFL